MFSKTPGCRWIAAILLYSLVAIVGWTMIDSVVLSSILIGGSLLLLDRCTFQLIDPLPRDQVVAEIKKRLLYFIAGVAAATALLGGNASWRELIFLGCLLSLGSVLLERIIATIHSGIAFRNSPWSRWLSLPALAVPVLLAVALFPAMSTLHPLRRVAVHTPLTLGIPFADVEIVTDDETRLSGWLIPAQHPRATAVYFHGHGFHRGQVLTMLPVLHEQGYDVLAFDFRGHGRSEGHTASFGVHEVQDVLAVCRLAQERAPDRPIVLVGVSYGAAVSLQSLPRLASVSAAWVEAPFGRLSAVAEYRYQRLPHLLRKVMIQGSYFVAWLDSGVWPPAINPVECLEGVEIPITFAHGRSDAIVPFSQAQALWDGYQGPKERFWPEQAGHCDFHNSNRTEYQRRLRAFLATHAT